MIEKIKTNKHLIRFFEWLYFPEKDTKDTIYLYRKIKKILGINRFRVENLSGAVVFTPVWNWVRIRSLIIRIIKNLTRSICGTVRTRN